VVAMTLAKPQHGSPCNNCGQCCQDQLCPLATHIFGHRHGPCPALQPDGEDHVCGVVRRPRQFVPVIVARHGHANTASAAAVLIGTGMGCDAMLAEGEDYDHAFRDRMLDWSRSNAARIDAAIKLFKLC
jgi:hypothetical protein